MDTEPTINLKEEYEQFREVLRLLTRRLSNVERDCFSCCGVTLTQCHLLGEVARSGPRTLGQLAQALELDPGSASRAVDAMVKQGYLERIAAAHDRRYVTISLTTAGAALSGDVESTGTNMATRILQMIPESEHALVFEALTLLAQALSSTDLEGQGCCATSQCSTGSGACDGARTEAATSAGAPGTGNHETN